LRRVVAEVEGYVGCPQVRVTRAEGDTSMSSSRAISLGLFESPFVWCEKVLDRCWIGWQTRFVVREGSRAVLSVDIVVDGFGEMKIDSQSRNRVRSNCTEENLKIKIQSELYLCTASVDPKGVQ
jgi:hypothetical protein